MEIALQLGFNLMIADFFGQPFSISSHMYGDYKSEISFVVAQGTL